MLRFLYGLLFVFALSAGGAYAKAGDPPNEKAALTVTTDTAIIQVRHFDSVALQSYAKQKEFQYATEGYVGPSLWDRFWHWVWSLFEIKDKSTASVFFSVVKYMILGLAIGTLIFFILKLSGVDLLQVIRPKPTGIALPYDEFIEDIHNVDLDTRIEEAVQQHNYRLAVRLLYLKCLKQLSDAGLINWQPSKTNRTYINELTDTGQKKSFANLTRQFEYVWYGQFNINAEVYARIKALFVNFNTRRA